MKRILVPTDFSECAASALRYAALIARQAEASIVLVHACDLLDPRFQSRKELIHEYNRTQTANLRRQLEALRMQTEEESKVQVITRLFEGAPVATVLQAIKDSEAGLVVMGTHGAAEKLNLLFGSTTAELMAESTVPVIAVPHHYVAKEPEVMLLATNSVSDANNATLFFELARLFGAKTRLVLYDRQTAEASAMLEGSRRIHSISDHLQRHHRDLPIESEMISGSDLRRSLEQCIEKHHADLLCMITHQAKGFFAKSHTLQMSYYTNIPLLAIPRLAEEKA